jgi:hypothetical protein
LKLIVVIPSILISVIFLTGCYTQVELPKHIPTKKLNKESERIVNFTYTVIDTFSNDWFPKEGYYYEFRFGLKNLKDDKIELFLKMLYEKGYNIIAAWYKPAGSNCSREAAIWQPQLRAQLIVLLSDVNDSIIEFNFYALMRKPEIVCPYKVKEYWFE